MSQFWDKSIIHKTSNFSLCKSNFNELFYNKIIKEAFIILYHLILISSQDRLRSCKLFLKIKFLRIG